MLLEPANLSYYSPSKKHPWRILTETQFKFLCLHWMQLKYVIWGCHQKLVDGKNCRHQWLDKTKSYSHTSLNARYHISENFKFQIMQEHALRPPSRRVYCKATPHTCFVQIIIFIINVVLGLLLFSDTEIFITTNVSTL